MFAYAFYPNTETLTLVPSSLSCIHCTRQASAPDFSCGTLVPPKCTDKGAGSPAAMDRIGLE